MSLLPSFTSLFVIWVFLNPVIAFAQKLICPVGETQIEEHPKRAYAEKDGTFVRKSQVAEHCREIFPGSKVWVSYFKNGVSENWPQKNETHKNWLASEKKIILTTVKELPDQLKLISLIRISRASVSKHKENPASSVVPLGELTLYDLFFKADNSTRFEILAHEMTHFLIKDFKNKELYDFSKIAGWGHVKKKGPGGEKVVIIAPRKLLLSDSNIDVEEDFANHMQIYLAKPEILKKFNISTYEWFFKKFPMGQRK